MNAPTATSRHCEGCGVAIAAEQPSYIKLCLKCYKAGKTSTAAEQGSPAAHKHEIYARKDDQIARMSSLNNAVKLTELFVLTKQWAKVDLANVYDIANQLKHFIDTGNIAPAADEVVK